MSRTTPLLDDRSLNGRPYVEAHSRVATDWFRQLMDDAIADHEGVALVATGGFGRGELWPFSDLDVVLLHHKRRDVADVAEKLWYPVWDRGLKLGHGVFTVKEAIELATAELDQATALLDTRLIAGDPSLLEALDSKVAKLWSQKSESLLTSLGVRVDERHRRVGDVAFKIEPDLKEGRGGLRDLHAMRWAERAEPGFANDALDELEPELDVLIDARVSLHRHRQRAGDVLALDNQDDVADDLGIASGQELMLRLALAARRIAWHSDEAWDRWQRAQTRPRRGRPWVILSDQLELVDAQIEIRPEVDPAADPLLVLRVAEQAARTGTTIGRRTLETLLETNVRIPTPWPDEARELFAKIFLSGKAAIDVVEDLDQFELMVRILPEWQAVRCRPQRNVMHTYTVDRHLCEAAANAAELAVDVSRPDLLVVGALLHDIGKGYPGDHTEVGMKLIETIGTRMGYPPQDVAVLVDLCRLHLLLPDVSARRDVTDPGTVRAVAAAVDSVEFLDLLAALTQADSMATGPSAWGSWKAGLLQDLVNRTAYMLEHGEIIETSTEFPTAEVLALMERGELHVAGHRFTLTVVAPDTPGLFGRIAGVLANSGLEVLDASAGSNDSGMAASVFTVQDSGSGPIDWDGVAVQVAQALDNRLALSARVANRAIAYGRFRRRLSAEPARREINIDNSISDVATVVDVHGPDTIGLLFRLTRAFGELGLNISSAKVQTLGSQAVDSFYVTRDGQKLIDPELLTELELAVDNAVGVEE